MGKGTIALNLTDYLNSVRDKPFEWGKHDCVTFASNAVKAMVGRDFIEELNLSWNTKEEAIAVLEQQGDLLEFLSNTLPFEKIHNVRFRQRGDLVGITTYQDEFPYALGIVSPNAKMVYVPSLIGFKNIHLDTISVVWRIEE